MSPKQQVAVTQILEGIKARGIDVSGVQPDLENYVALRIRRDWPTIWIGPRGGVEVVGYHDHKYGTGYIANINAAIHADELARDEAPTSNPRTHPSNQTWYDREFQRAEEIHRNSTEAGSH